MYKNKGMFLEELINKTNCYLYQKNIGFVDKRFHKVYISKIKGNKVSGFLGNKNYVDYYGLIKNTHIEFEAKSTNKPYFIFSKIKKTQLSFLLKMKEFGAKCFFIIYFSQNKLFIKIKAWNIWEMIQQGKKSIKLNEAIKKGYQIKIRYPGILNYW